MKLLMAGSLPEISLTVSTDQTSYNIKSKAGNPAAAALIIITINSGIKVRDMVTGTLVAGTKVRVINNGCIYGTGGTGGTGGNAQAGVTNPGTAGTAGNPAIDMQVASLTLEVNNANGYILGGGAGGHGGASFTHPLQIEAGGGGGGGAGGGTGGNGGSGGTQGTASAGGPAGVPVWTGSYWDQGFPGFYWEYGDGGAGGVGFYGSGARGDNGTKYGTSGKAINLNGTPITWLGGNNSTQVKGAVS